MSLQSILEVEVLDYWGDDFVGPFPPILVAVDYVSKWAKEISSPKADEKMVVKYLEKIFLARFGIPRVLISDWGFHLCNNLLAKALENYGARHKVASPYHP